LHQTAKVANTSITGRRSNSAFTAAPPPAVRWVSDSPAAPPYRPQAATPPLLI